MLELAVVLAILLVFTNIFWAIQCNKLVNKVMAGNYQTYQHTVKPPVQKEHRVQLSNELEADLGVLAQFR